MNSDKIALKTMAIKARVYNEIRKDLFHKLLEENFYSKYKKYEVLKYEVLKDEDKIKLFNKWFELNKEAHRELDAYKSKRKYKAKVLKLREEKKNLVDSEITPNFTD